MRVRARRRAGRASARVLAHAAAALIALGLASCEWGRTPPNVVFVLIDTLRADRLGSYGNERGLTPFLDELAGRGVVFSRAYAPSSWTVPSIASLFTSRHAAQHHVGAYESKLGDDEVTLAEKLAAADYATAGFFANFRLLPKLGYAQGFSSWEAVVSEPGKNAKPRGAMCRGTGAGASRSFCTSTSWSRTVPTRRRSRSAADFSPRRSMKRRSRRRTASCSASTSTS
jgi:hypothetical protein